MPDQSENVAQRGQSVPTDCGGRPTAELLTSNPRNTVPVPMVEQLENALAEIERLRAMVKELGGDPDAGR